MAEAMVEVKAIRMYEFLAEGAHIDNARVVDKPVALETDLGRTLARNTHPAVVTSGHP